jgi:hypothetical protein
VVARSGYLNTIHATFITSPSRWPDPEHRNDMSDVVETNRMLWRKKTLWEAMVILEGQGGVRERGR